MSNSCGNCGGRLYGGDDHKKDTGGGEGWEYTCSRKRYEYQPPEDDGQKCCNCGGKVKYYSEHTTDVAGGLGYKYTCSGPYSGQYL